MMQNILVGVLLLVVVGAGAFGWWSEHNNKDTDDVSENATQTEYVEKAGNVEHADKRVKHSSKKGRR